MVHQSQFVEMFGSSISNTHRVSDYFGLKAGKSISAEDINTTNEDDLYPCYGGNGLRGFVKNFTHDGEFVLIGRQGALCGNVQLASGKFYATEHAVVVTPKQRTNPIWLFFAFSAMNLNQYARGVAQPGLAVSQLEQLAFQMPELDEQETFSRIAVQADKSKFDGFKSQFISQFGFPQDGADRYPSATIESMLQETISGEWGTDCTDESGTKVIRTTNFTNNGVLDLTDVVVRTIDPRKVEKKHLKKGDIILEKSGGTKDNPVGRLVFFEEDGVYLANNFTQVLRPAENINSKYLFSALYYLYQTHKSLIKGLGNQTNGIQNLKVPQYLQLQICVPDRDKQDEFEMITRQADKSKYMN